MRQIPKRGATAHTHTIASKDGKKVNEEARTRDITTDIEDGPAQVQVTHGIKRWESNRESGMSVETTCTVTIPCARNENVMQRANNYAASMAHEFAWKDHKAIQGDLDRFVDWLEKK
jgi:hypothetical protein